MNFWQSGAEQARVRENEHEHELVYGDWKPQYVLTASINIQLSCLSDCIRIVSFGSESPLTTET